MGKVIFWLVVVFAVLFVLRLINAAKHKARPGTRTPEPLAETMVRCVECGVYLPRDAARGAAGSYRCADGLCDTRKAKSRE